jgi:hypothetical protein
MTSTKDTHVPAAEGPRSAPGRDRADRDAQPSRSAARSVEDEWPTDVQVWSWVESAVLAGYGPPASYFI